MCKIGDIIAVPNFIGDGNNLVITHYFVVGQVDGDVLIRILERMQYLDMKGNLKQNIANIKTEINC